MFSRVSRVNMEVRGMYMAYKINITDLTTAQLSASCLVKITKFAVALERHNGTVLNLKDEHVLRELVKEAKRADTSELDDLYRSLKLEISKHINSPKFIKHMDDFDHIYAGSGPSQTTDWAVPN